MVNWQSLVPSTLSTRLFIIVTIIESIVNITIEAIILNKFELRAVFSVSKFDDSSSHTLLKHLIRSEVISNNVSGKRIVRSVAHTVGGGVVGVGSHMLNSFKHRANFDSTSTSQILPRQSSSSATATQDQIDSNSQVLPVYLALFVLAHLYQLFLAIEGIANKNTIQIVGLCFFNAAFLAYSILQIGEIRDFFPNDDVTGLVTVIPAMIGVAEAAFVCLTWFIFREFGWQIYKKIGADRSLKKMYMWYQVFICVLKFDYFFFIAFSLQLVLLVQNLDDLERYLTIAAIPLILAGLFAGAIAVKRENRVLMTSFIGACFVGAGYFAFKLFRIFQKRKTDYALVFKSLTVFSAFSLILLLITTWVAYMCLLNFGKELKFHLTHEPRNKAEKAYEAEMSGATLPLGNIRNSKRLSID